MSDVCEHGELRRKCPHCLNVRLEARVAELEAQIATLERERAVQLCRAEAAEAALATLRAKVNETTDALAILLARFRALRTQKSCD